MSSVDPLIAQWLQSPGLSAVEKDIAVEERWNDSALVTERSTTLALKEDAEVESARVIAFRGQPMVEDVAELKGEFVSAIGQVITIEGSDLGYDAGIDVFVIGAIDNRAAGTSRVTVLRRL
mgnify:CR=1 FL=1|tara:strand:- start:522 stop:884 length:363 start_codon:yes stop_codon:yes gene_type:complete